MTGRIVISEFMDDEAVDRLKAAAEIVYDPSLVDEPDRLRPLLRHADALIVRNRTQVRGEMIEAAPSLKVVGRLGVGLDNIDMKACVACGIEVIPATGANAAAVAEYVIATTLILLRGAYGATEEVLGGGWPRTRLVGGEAQGRTLGLLGFGMIAREVAARARALGMRTIAHDPMLPADDPAWSAHGVESVDFERLLSASDMLSLHVPLTKETRNLIGSAALARMKSGAVLVNTARGGIVDESALATALRDGRLGGAALDVFAEEPLAAGTSLSGAPNLIATPHIAGVTVESNRRVSAMIADKVLAALGASAR
ncbi:hydroxyacid dehydrogenase [Inquilinus sp. CAU 1745]|uniref:hydroxyacid dehydrogenase n=1 Tax=Inquilinus sp. CAU 1745 TaxID=3140369 RepID=UPI00325BCF40